MSNFFRWTKHPDTHEWEEAQWLDDYYGRHKYGVKFEDGQVVDTSRIELETSEDNPN